MCRPLHYLLLQPCASDAQAAAEKWVIQPWGSPALPLSLYPPLPQSPLYLCLSYPPPFTPCHSIPLLLLPTSPLTFLVTWFSLLDQYNPRRTWVFLHLSFSPVFFIFSSSASLSHSITPAVLITFCHLSSVSDVFGEVKRMTKRADGAKLRKAT